MSGTDSFSYTLADGHGGVQTATVTVTMVEVTDWTLQPETLDGTWVSVPDDEVCWAHDNLRWTAEFGPKDPPDVLGIDWLAKPWDQRDDPGASWDEFAFSEADAPGLGSPGAGDWGITPEVMLSAPNQTEFAVQMAQPKRKIVAKIEEIEWATHGNAGRPGIRRLLGCICNGRIRRTRLFSTSVPLTR